MSAIIPEDCYRRDLKVSFLDEMIAHINSCFSEIQKKAMLALSLVPSVLMSPEHEQSTTDLAHQLAEFYADDLPQSINTSAGATLMEVEVEELLS